LLLVSLLPAAGTAEKTTASAEGCAYRPRNDPSEAFSLDAAIPRGTGAVVMPALAAISWSMNSFVTAVTVVELLPAAMRSPSTTRGSNLAPTPGWSSPSWARYNSSSNGTPVFSADVTAQPK
jgi:hypothetical protein